MGMSKDEFMKRYMSDKNKKNERWVNLDFLGFNNYEINDKGIVRNDGIKQSFSVNKLLKKIFGGF